MSTRIHEYSLALDRSCAHVARTTMDEDRYFDIGHVSTIYGIVGLYAQYQAGHPQATYTILSVVVDGREYRRTIEERCLEDRALLLAARKFAQAVLR